MKTCLALHMRDEQIKTEDAEKREYVFIDLF